MEEPKPDTGSGAGAKNKGNKPQFRSFKKHGNTNVNFEGCIPALKGHVYNCSGPSQAVQYTTTTREIADMSRQHSRMGMMLRQQSRKCQYPP